MNDVITYALTLLAGLGIGLLFFGGLWLTVRALPAASTTNRTVLLSIGSFMLRLLLATGGFYLVARSADWLGVLLALLGFLIMRVAMAVPMQRRLNADVEKKSEAA